MLRLLLLLSFLIGITEPTHAAQKENATHMWIDAGYTPTYIRIGSLSQCRTLTEQASTIDSSATSHCYNGETFLLEIKCQRPSKKGAAIKCETHNKPNQ